jgi:hypothetical protein
MNARTGHRQPEGIGQGLRTGEIDHEAQVPAEMPKTQ